MTRMSRITFQQLVADHDAIEALARALAASVAEPGGEDELVLGGKLDGLARQVEEHLARESGLVEPMVGQLRAGGGEAEADRLTGDLDRLKTDWRTYLDRWTPARIRADRDGFRVATGAMMPRLAAQVRLESEVLYAPALQKSLIALR